MQQTPLKPAIDSRFASSQDPPVDASNYITVTCRLKPLLPQEQRSLIDIDKSLHQITINDPNKTTTKTYTFDRICDQTICQDRFANHICTPLVNFLKNGGECGLIFSYGISNSGKTYTILGTNENPGILLTLIKKLEKQFPDETLKIVACELYKEKFISLKSKGQKPNPKDVKAFNSLEECDSDEINESNMNELFSNYLQNRSCAPNAHNSVSSRSHAIFKITSKNFKLGVVDLAGSQKLSDKTDEKETIFINKSLFYLKKCIMALESNSTLSKKNRIPYRQSKLTEALMEYFVFNSKINIIVNINQASHYLDQNLNAMDYTSKAKNIKPNAAMEISMRKPLKFVTTNKKVEAISVIRHKVFPLTNGPKRYSEKIIAQQKYIIDEQLVEAEEIERSLQREIQMQQRREQIMQRQTDQMFEQFMEGPNLIQDFIEKQRIYREIYLKNDLDIDLSLDKKKLLQLQQANFMITTQKKEKPISQSKLSNYVQTSQFGTEILPGELINESDQIEQKIAKIQYDKLRTSVKNKLMLVLDEQRKKQLIDAQTMWSERKSQQLEKNQSNQIQQKSIEDEENSNYTTPDKKCVKRMGKTKTIAKPSQKKGIFQSVVKGAQSALDKVTSCMKSGAKFMTGFGKSHAKLNTASRMSRPKGRKINLQYQREFNLLIRPESKIVFEIAVETEVEIVPSSKKIKLMEQEAQTNADGDIEIDLDPVVVEKELMIETFEVGIQTDQIEVKYLMDELIEENIEEQKQKIPSRGVIKQKRSKCFSQFSEESTLIEDDQTESRESMEINGKQEKKILWLLKDKNALIKQNNEEQKQKQIIPSRGVIKQKRTKCFPSFSEEQRLIEDNEPGSRESMERGNENKNERSMIPLLKEKTAFKNFSLMKSAVKASVKKQRHYITGAKNIIAKNTRAAKRKMMNDFGEKEKKE